MQRPKLKPAPKPLPKPKPKPKPATQEAKPKFPPRPPRIIKKVTPTPNIAVEPRKLIPENQVLGLTDAQLKEDIIRILTTSETLTPINRVRYSYKERQFVQEEDESQERVHLNIFSNLVPQVKNAVDEIEYEPERHEKLVKNHFNHIDRAVQTPACVKCDRKLETEPPRTTTFSATCSPSEIYDTYLAMAKASLNAKASNSQSKKYTKDDEKAPLGRDSQGILNSASLNLNAKIMERIVHQIADAKTFLTLRSAAFGEKELAPLWRFSCEAPASGPSTVTAIAWNPKHQDMFAVALGSYDFLRQGPGAVSCFSLKNSVAEFTVATEASALCLDWHPKLPSLLAVGLYNGKICVFNVRNQQALFELAEAASWHAEPVWQVRWEAATQPLAFVSTSTDGRVAHWSARRNELVVEDIVVLGPPIVKDELGTAKQGGVCFDSQPTNPEILVVGTDAGTLQSFKRSIRTQRLHVYDGHKMIVHTVKWNPIQPNWFISCSADWTVKIWLQGVSKCTFELLLHDSVNDVAWCPFAAEMFAAVTADGWV